MRLLLTAATALVLVPVAAAAAAATWYSFYSDANSTWYVDADSIKKSGDWTSVTQYAVYAKVSEETGVKSVKARSEVDCKRRVYRMTYFEPFGADGTSMGGIDTPDDLAEHDEVPGSPNGASMKFICDKVRTGATRVADPTPH